MMVVFLTTASRRTAIQSMMALHAGILFLLNFQRNIVSKLSHLRPKYSICYHAYEY